MQIIIPLTFHSVYVHVYSFRRLLFICPILIKGRGTASRSLWAHPWNIEATIPSENERGEADCQLSVQDQLIRSPSTVICQRSAEGCLPCA